VTSHQRTRTRLDPAVRRQQIAEAAARVFAEHDPAEVSFEAVAEEAGVSRALVYSYFGDRGSLFAAAYTYEQARLDADIDGALESMGDDRDRLARAVAAYLQFAWRHRKEWELIASASASRHPAVREAVGARTDQIARSLGGSPEARLLVRGVIGMLEAAAVHTLEQDEVDHATLAELLTQVIWAGVSSLRETTSVAEPSDPEPSDPEASDPEIDVPEP
jgi:AcrR family transcriptional regulator